MLGHNKLYHHGVPGRGVIINLHEEREFGQVKHYDVVVQVEFDDGTHGQISQRLKHAEVGNCRTGDILPVRYDGKDHGKLVLDMPAIEVSKHMPKESAGGDYQQPQATMPGNAASVLGALFGGASSSVGDIIREARRDPQGLRDRLIQQAQAAGAFVVTSQGNTPSGTPDAGSGFPSQSGFPASSGFPDPSAYQNQTGFPDPSAYQGQTGFPDPSAYQNQTGFPEPAQPQSEPQPDPSDKEF
jgi:hypothetical protein